METILERERENGFGFFAKLTERERKWELGPLAKGKRDALAIALKVS